MNALEKNKTVEQLIEEASKGFLQGIHELPHEVYHDPRCPGLSRSALLKLLESPKHYQHWLLNPDTPTPRMIFGANAHCALLEPHVFEKKFTYYPKTEEFQGRSKAAIQARADFDQVHAGQTILDAEDYERIGKIMEALYRCPEAVELLKGQKERTKFWTEKTTGLLCKVRPDCLQENRIIDLKITGSGSKDHFLKTAAQLDYQIQAAFYLDAFQLKDFIFLCVEDAEPFEVSIFQLDEESIDLGRRQYLRALQTFQDSTQKKQWGGYPKGVQTLRLPAWKFYQEGESL